MSARDSLFLFHYPVLRDPPCDIAFAPDAALGKLAHRLREGLHLRDLVGPLAAHAEQLAYLGGAYEFHACSMPVALDSVKRRWFNALDTVKRRNRR